MSSASVLYLAEAFFKHYGLDPAAGAPWRLVRVSGKRLPLIIDARGIYFGPTEVE